MHWAALSAGVIVALVSACAAPVPREPTPPPVATARPAALEATRVVVQTTAPPGPGIPAAVVRALASPSPVALPLSVVAGRSGADVRVALDRLLQEQMFLTTLGMDAASNARLDELLGVSGALDQNSLALAQVLGAIKGQLTAESFLAAWRGQNADLIQYAQGKSAAANVDLSRRGSAIAEQLAMGDFAASAVEDLLRTRHQAQLGLAEASIGHDQAELSRRLRLAAADSSADEFGQRLAAVWGPDLGNGLADRLRAETATLVSLASGGSRSQAAGDLDRLRGEIDGLLSQANPLLPKGLLSQQLRPSDQPLLMATDAFVARDFVSAYTRLAEAARQVQKPADAIALSIVDRFPGRYLLVPTPVAAEAEP
ncbi:MAG: hypothetical protein LC797_10900 [Chloroflexi bacterium]|nr:hypothetical protein [Chloroflexota bacterium]